MQVVNINHVSYNIPVSWAELNYKQASDVIKHVDNKPEQLKAITGIDLDIIDALPDTHAHSLFSLIAFTEDLTPFENADVLEKYIEFDFGSVPYGTAEKIRKALNKDVTGFEASIDIIKILKDEDISTMPFLEIIGTANFFLGNTLTLIVVLPNLANIRQAMNKSPRALSDSIVLEGLARTLKSQGVAH